MLFHRDRKKAYRDGRMAGHINIGNIMGILGTVFEHTKLYLNQILKLY